MRVLILAAGYGTRLYPLTNTVAKPLVAINGVPLLNYLIDKINKIKKAEKISETRIVVNNKFYADFLAWQKQYDVEAVIVNDGSNSPDDRRGAIGDIKFAIGDTADDWLIAGGDNLFEDDLREFIDFSKGKRPFPCVGVYDVHDREEAARCGVVALGSGGRITNFQEKPKQPFSTIVASCVYFFPKESLALFEEFLRSNPNIDASGKYIEWLSRRDQAFAYVLSGKWIDIGHLKALKAAEKEFGVERGRAKGARGK